MRGIPSRIAALEAQSGAQGVGRYGEKKCGNCGLSSYRITPPGMLTVDQIEAAMLAQIGGKLFASWPRCEDCRRMLPIEQVILRINAEDKLAKAEGREAT
jgi:hypothetical protein